MRFPDQFALASARDPEQLLGCHAVHLVGWGLPRPLRFFGHAKVVEAAAGAVVGHNAFLGGRLRLGHFRVSRSRADDGAEVTRISYDDPRNPFFMRPLTDEVRDTGGGHFLGRGMYRLGRRAHNLFWFTVG